MRSADSMQTPPPTSTSASKRKAQQAQVAKLVQDSASRVRKLSSPTFAQPASPEQDNQFIQDSPHFFPSLEFSPDVFEFPSEGPATAPIYPQQKLFWDPDTSIRPMDMDFPGEGLDGFEPNPSFDFDQYVSTQSAVQPVLATSAFGVGVDRSNVMGQTVPSQLFPTHTSRPEVSACANSTVRLSRKKPAVKSMTVEHAVDPNLLLSDPGHQDSSHNLGTFTKKVAAEVRQPYLHQKQESRREKEHGRTRRANSKHTPHSSSSRSAAPYHEKRPRLERRSSDTVLGNAGSNTRKHSQVSPYQCSQAEEERDSKHLPRKLSPIKSNTPEGYPTTFDHPKLRPQTSVTFTIDDNGRARTETKITTEESESETDKDTKRIDHQAWGNSDSETSEDAEADIATSFYSSFTFPSSKQPKLARFSTDSISHSKTSSFSSTYASSRSEHTVSDVGPSSQIRRRSSHAIKGHNSSGMHNSYTAGLRSSGVMSELDPDAGAGDLPSEAETVVDSDQTNGDAQHALKRVMKERARRKRTDKSTSSGSNLKGKPRRQAVPSTKYQAHSSSSHHPILTTPTKIQPRKAYDPTINSSPTTITDPDLTSPSTDRGSSASDSTRCVCLTSESGGHLMIQWYGYPPNKMRAAELTVTVIHVKNGFMSGASVSLPNESPPYTSAYTAPDTRHSSREDGSTVLPESAL